MINIYWAKRWVSYILTGVITLATFIFLILQGTDMWLSIGISLLATILMGVISRRFLIAHPMLDYLEGRGLIVKTLDSTGLIKTFVAQLEPPYIRGKIGNKEIEDVFDRNAMMYETTPAKATMEDTGDTIVIKIPKETYYTVQFREHVYPVFIWNANLKTFLTKESLSNLESDALLDHALLYLMRKIEELDSHLRDFGRYVVDTIKPRWFGGIIEFVRRNPILVFFLILVLIAFLILGAYPDIINIFGGAVEEAAKTTTEAVGAVGVRP